MSRSVKQLQEKFEAWLWENHRFDYYKCAAYFKLKTGKYELPETQKMWEACLLGYRAGKREQRTKRRA